MATINPNTWLSLDLSQKSQEQVFMKQLVQYLTNQFTSAALAGILNGANALTGASLVVNTSALGTKSSSFTFDCKSSFLSVISFTMGADLTLTLSNLPIGALLFMTVNWPVTHNLLMAASIPGGGNYATIFLNYGAGGANHVDMIGSGFNDTVGQDFVMMCGATLTGPALNLIGQ